MHGAGNWTHTVCGSYTAHCALQSGLPSSDPYEGELEGQRLKKSDCRNMSSSFYWKLSRWITVTVTWTTSDPHTIGELNKNEEVAQLRRELPEFSYVLLQDTYLEGQSPLDTHFLCDCRKVHFHFVSLFFPCSSPETQLSPCKVVTLQVRPGFKCWSPQPRSSETLGKWLHLPKCQFSHLHNGHDAYLLRRVVERTTLEHMSGAATVHM